MDEVYCRTLERAVRHLCTGADAVCDDVKSGGVPRLNAMTGGYSWDEGYVWNSWGQFPVGPVPRWPLMAPALLAHEQRYAAAAMHICERIGPVLAQHPTAFSSTGIDMYYALTLGYQITKDERLKQWAFAGGDNFAAIFDHNAGAFLQIAGADRIVINTGLNLPSMLWASQWEPERAVLAYRHLDTVLQVGLVRSDGANCHAAALDPHTRVVKRLFSSRAGATPAFGRADRAGPCSAMRMPTRRAAGRTIWTRRGGRPTGMCTRRKAGCRDMTTTIRTV